MEKIYMEIDFKALGIRIRSIRKSKGMTQEFMSEQLDISPQHMSNIENALKNPSLGLLANIAEILDVTMDELLIDSYPEEKRKIKDFQCKEFELLMEGCNGKEKRIVADVLAGLIKSMKRNREL